MFGAGEQRVIDDRERDIRKQIAPLLRTALLLIVTMPGAIDAQTCRQMIARTQSLAAAKNWTAAESSARASIARCPDSNDARRTLGQVLLWTGRYDQAREVFVTLLAKNARDAESRLGLAQAEYWSGDYRSALRDFERIAQQQPQSVEAVRAIAEIRAASRPGYTAAFDGISDDQPYRSSAASMTAHVFSDPLTKWEIGTTTMRVRAFGLTRDVRTVSGGGETQLPSVSLGLRAVVRWMRFPDGRDEVMPIVAVDRRIGPSLLTVALQRRDLLRAAAALRSHPYVDALSVRIAGEPSRRVQYAVGAESLRYFDGNRGTSADAFVLVPLRWLSLGASAAYRNTRDPRFRANTSGYDPYWTPHDLREVRAIAAAAVKRSGAVFDLHLDGGIARDRVLYFAAGAPSYERTFHPWRASIGVTSPPVAGMIFRMSAERVSTVFYTANEIHAGLAGRF